jgi:hypothetical protein
MQNKLRLQVIKHGWCEKITNKYVGPIIVWKI